MKNAYNESGINIEKLPEIVKGKWGVYFLCKRSENVAIYSKDFEKDKAFCFEVFHIRKIDAKKSAESFNRRFGSNYDLTRLPDFKEKYPKDEDFGKCAWTYRSFNQALSKFNILEEEYKNDKA